MDGKGPLTQDDAYKKLQELFNASGKSINLKELFAADKERFAKFRYGVNLGKVTRGVEWG